ncbi:MAG: 4Fe-4S binding protein [Candidatus Hydrothermarchaeales archaeon]
MTKLRGGMGLLAQSQKDYVTIRLQVTRGKLSIEQLNGIADVLDNYGKGFAIPTIRKGLEIPWIKFEDSPKVLEEFKKLGLKAGSCGTKIRTIVACAGMDHCPLGLVDIEGAYAKLKDEYYERDTPTKFKISICGCPMACSHPHINDFGIIGRIRPKIIAEKCDGCGICARVCKGEEAEAKYKVEQDAIVEGNPPKIDYDRCIGCGLCMRSCPREAIAAEEAGFALFIGGKGGRHPRFGEEVVGLVSEEEMFRILDKTLKYFKKFAQGKERIVEVINRKGIEHFKNYVLEGGE